MTNSNSSDTDSSVDSNMNEHRVNASHSMASDDTTNHDAVNTAATKKQVQYPTSDWQKFGEHHWTPSDLSKDLYQTMIDIGDGIELCVEAGGNPDNPPLLMIMGLGSQMIFWPNSFIKRLIDAGFFVIRFDNRDIGLSSKVQIDGLPRVNQLKMMFRLQAGLSNKSEQVAYKLTDMA